MTVFLVIIGDLSFASQSAGKGAFLILSWVY